MPSSAIGLYSVLTMDRRPTPPAQKIQLEAKPGVAGNAAWATGVRSEPQQITTLVDVSNWASAVTLCGTYQSLIGSVVTLTYAGVALAYNALILDVDAQPEPILRGIGGLSGGSQAMVRARWTIETRA